ncbi:MAG TPA: SDR family oxidoreductase [Burkholderiales bacterium]|nr:SDR family oxidoreductase [Burkholderiales bacterium]
MPALRVFITGGSSGLGAALTELYLSRGAVVGAVSRHPERLSLQSERLSLYRTDVADAAAMQITAREYIAVHGLPDIVIANAGVSVGVDTFLPEDLSILERTLRTNVCGVANSFQPFLALMRGRGSGTLVSIASVAGLRGLAGSSAYAASKSAVITWMESLRLEIYGSGLKAVTICPGYVDTPMTRVNRYRMPFLLSAETAARRIARVIDRGSAYAVVPWQMGCIAALLRCMPRVLYDRLFAQAPRKPRNLPT